MVKGEGRIPPLLPIRNNVQCFKIWMANTNSPAGDDLDNSELRTIHERLVDRDRAVRARVHDDRRVGVEPELFDEKNAVRIIGQRELVRLDPARP